MADGTQARLSDLLAARTARYRIATADECFDDFRGEAQESTTASLKELLDDRETLREIAAEILIAFGKIKTLHARLGEARAVSEKTGCNGVRITYPKLVALDEYAVIEALFPDHLSAAAEKLLKAELREAMQ